MAHNWDVIEQPMVDYFNASRNTNATQLWGAIHVDSNPSSTKFYMGSAQVATALQADTMLDYSQDFNSLFASGLPVLIYAGEFDAQDGPGTQNPWLKRLNIPNATEFWSQARSIYYLWDEQLGQYNTGGYYRQNSAFSFLSVPKAGHFVPSWTNYYATTYKFLSDMVNNQTLMCPFANHGGNCSTAVAQIESMNNCGEGGVPNYMTGQCDCKKGYAGGDCNQVLVDLQMNNTY